ncbi:MAG TPA: hypothetical protein VG962_08505 [Steroidobacteraceae bacterium]|nr:hypothetical protein [Steroidobacteraceae bacterium]
MLAAAALFAMNTVQAQVQRSGNDTARVMQQLQQVMSEKAQLQTENDSLKKQLQELQAKVGKAGSEQAALQQRTTRELEASNARQKENETTIQQLRDKLQELIAKFRETATQLQSVETDREKFKNDLAARDRDYNTCVDRNAGLYFLNDEILRKLEDHSIWDTVREKEPFTRLARTRLENLIDDYRDRVEELRVNRKTAATQ